LTSFKFLIDLLKMKASSILLTFTLLIAPSLARATPLRVTLAGDSIVAKNPGGKIVGWGVHFLEALQEKNPEAASKMLVTNRAVGGQTARSYFNRYWPEVLKTQPDIVFVEFGHNDADTSRSADPPGEKPSSYATRLTEYIRSARKTGMTPVLVTPPHRWIFEKGKVSDDLDGYRQAMREVARVENVALVDLAQKTESLLNTLGPAKSKELFVGTKRDITHYNKKGARVLASLVVEGVCEKQGQKILREAFGCKAYPVQQDPVSSGVVAPPPAHQK
jgi:lysophospholipase L1-like esterase